MSGTNVVALKCLDGLLPPNAGLGSSPSNCQGSTSKPPASLFAEKKFEVTTDLFFQKQNLVPTFSNFQRKTFFPVSDFFSRPSSSVPIFFRLTAVRSSKCRSTQRRRASSDATRQLFSSFRSSQKFQSTFMISWSISWKWAYYVLII